MTEVISESIVKNIVKSLKRGKQVRRHLPDGGLVHIDRPLPFLTLFRHPAGKPDHATADFVKTEASYIIAKEEQTEELAMLVREIAKAMSDKFGAFMVLELFAAPSPTPDTPMFRVLGPKEALPATVNVLKKELEQIKIENMPITVGTASNKPLLEGPQRLLSEEELKQLSCLMLGLELKPVYLNSSTGNIYPLLQRTLRTNLSNAIKKAVFDFVRVQTTHHPKHFQTLGRRAVVAAVWRIDKQLAAISNQFQFLMLVTPVNATDAWKQFVKSKFSKAPTMHYRLMPIDVDLLKRKLYNIPIEKVEDPTLGYLFRDKRHELDKMLTMLSDRNTPDFLYSSLQVFGGVDEQLLKVAEGILTALPEPEPPSDEPLICATEFAAVAEQEIRFLKDQYPPLSTGVEVRDDIVGLMVSRGRLMVGTDYKVPKGRVEALIQHEVGTHVLTYFNGKAQPLQQLYVGVPGYEELQEGLAVLSEYLVGGLSHDRMRLLAARVVAVHHLIKGCSFSDNYWRLKDDYKFDEDTAFDITMRVHRGGGFTKDAVYLRGLVHLLQYLKEGGELEPLLIGKIRQDYIPIMEELIYRNVLRSVPIKPRYLLNPAVQPKLEQLKKGLTVFNLL